MYYKRVLILHFTNGMSGREIADTTGDKKTTVNEFLKRFRECEELSYPLSEDVTNEFIAGCLYKKAGNPVNSDLYCFSSSATFAPASSALSAAVRPASPAPTTTTSYSYSASALSTATSRLRHSAASPPA